MAPRSAIAEIEGLEQPSVAEISFPEVPISGQQEVQPGDSVAKDFEFKTHAVPSFAVVKIRKPNSAKVLFWKEKNFDAKSSHVIDFGTIRLVR